MIVDTALVPVDELTEYPGNARRGDIEAIAESIRANGFYGVVVRQASTGYVLAGNHRVKAAKIAGLDTVPVQTVDVDDTVARRINLVDNQSNALGSFDSASLADLLALALDDGGLVGTGFTSDDLADLHVELEAPVEKSTVPPQFNPEGTNSQNGRRLIALDLAIPRYVWAIDALGKVQADAGVGSNTEAVLWLLSQHLGVPCPNG